MKKIGLLLLILFTQAAGASLITLQSLDISNRFALSSGQSFSQYWDIYAAGVNSPQISQLEEFSHFRTGKNTLNLLRIEVSVFGSDTTLDLFAGLDAHYGIEVYINGSSVFAQYQDFWWQRNWEHSAVVRLQNLSLLSNENVLELYWAERCCDGANSIKFALNSGNPNYLSKVELAEAMAVSSPSSLPIWILGILGLFANAGRKIL